MLSLDLYKEYKSKKRKATIAYKIEFKGQSITALYGKSGIGKSSILRMIAGLETPERGKLVFNDEVWFDRKQKINLPIQKRDVGFVFQDYNLFPNMTVERNLKYASSTNKITEPIHQLLVTTGLLELLNVYPNELSSGQQQRIAIIRALCQQPQLLLLDEPFSALDDEAISKLIEQIKLIQHNLNMTIVIVSHRKSIVMEMAESIVHLKENGLSEQLMSL